MKRILLALLVSGSMQAQELSILSEDIFKTNIVGNWIKIENQILPVWVKSTNVIKDYALSVVVNGIIPKEYYMIESSTNLMHWQNYRFIFTAFNAYTNYVHHPGSNPFSPPVRNGNKFYRVRTSSYEEFRGELIQPKK
jgi:hypothetical protein